MQAFPEPELGDPVSSGVERVEEHVRGDAVGVGVSALRGRLWQDRDAAGMLDHKLLDRMRRRMRSGDRVVTIGERVGEWQLGFASTLLEARKPEPSAGEALLRLFDLCL